MYSVEGLERGIEAIDKNIKVFEKAIRDEEAKKEQYRAMIVELKMKEHESKLANIVIDTGIE